MRETLLAMQKEHLIESGDAVVARNEASGRVKLNKVFQRGGRPSDISTSDC